MIATAGDRRDQDMIDLGLEAAKQFDRIIVRRTSGCVAGRPRDRRVDRQGRAAGAGRWRPGQQIDVVLDEIEATKVAVEGANPGDLVLVCVDRARAVWDELQVIGQRAQAGSADE